MVRGPRYATPWASRPLNVLVSWNPHPQISRNVLHLDASSQLFPPSPNLLTTRRLVVWVYSRTDSDDTQRTRARCRACQAVAGVAAGAGAASDPDLRVRPERPTAKVRASGSAGAAVAGAARRRHVAVAAHRRHSVRHLCASLRLRRGGRQGPLTETRMRSARWLMRRQSGVQGLPSSCIGAPGCTTCSRIGENPNISVRV